MGWEFGISRCKLLCREWINKRVLVYSPGNSIQYPVINHHGKEHRKSVHICITELLYCTAEINTPLCINYMFTKKIKIKNIKFIKGK